MAARMISRGERVTVRGKTSPPAPDLTPRLPPSPPSPLPSEGEGSRGVRGLRGGAGGEVPLGSPILLLQLRLDSI
jgi:hypothetical protein